MKAMQTLHEELRSVAGRAIVTSDTARLALEMEGLLDGAFSTRFREIVTLKQRQRAGTFFTPSSTAQLLVAMLPSDKPLIDPSFGAGDLLIAHASRLPVRKSLESTLAAWGPYLRGIELRKDLVRVAKLRLIMLALLRGAQATGAGAIDESQWFPFLRQGNALIIEPSAYAGASVATNPPFGAMKARSKDAWSTGKVARAAVHLASSIEHAEAGTRMAALLPDVLRSGSRYGKWREWVASRLDEATVTILGRFDDATDVDVFMLNGKISKQISSRAWPSPRSPSGKTLQDSFSIRVGSVVPHRDPKRGPKRRYIHARTVGPWTEVHRVAERRRFLGTVFQPPFVVIRRTSSPSDRRRATAAIVLGKDKVAVENHLLVAMPKNASLDACRKLANYLNSEAVDDQLNKRIRCRHLTVQAVREIPYEASK